MYQGVYPVIGNGCIVDPEVLLGEVDMLEALLHGRRRKEQAANTLPEEQTDTAADKSPDTDGQQQ